jgi:phage tail-like protein
VDGTVTPDKHADTDPAVSVCFAVSIDHNSLGTFNSCEGLGCEVVLEQREEGGNNAFVWQLPTRLKFSTVKLTRPVGKDTTKVARWFSSMATGVRPRTATIAAMSAEGRIVAQWDLMEVVPVRWSGPSLNLDSPKVATETIELAHHGFGPPDRSAR